MDGRRVTCRWVVADNSESSRTTRVGVQSFLTQHAWVMLFIARHVVARIRDIAVDLEVTERTVQAIVQDLAEAGYVIKQRREKSRAGIR
jgi:DNA-binding MarR family transcriptional regulator